MPKVSIIIPVYNAEKFLKKCVQTLIDQTLSDIEIIFINDGSTDNSLQILEYYAAIDKRIKILDQKNSGQGIARNNAIEIANGEYLGFVDPDDWVAPSMFETLYNKAKIFDCDLVEESFVIHNEPRKYTKKFKNKLNLPKEKLFSGLQIKKYIFSAKLVVWNKLYKKDFIKANNIKFMNTIVGEDIIFTVLSRALANNIIYLDVADYHYRIKNYYEISPAFNKLLFYNKIDFYAEIKNILIEHMIFKDIKEIFYKWVLDSAVGEYKKQKRDEKFLYKNKMKTFLPEKYFQVFKKRIIFYEFFNNIFSVYNVLLNGRKYKIFKIFGFEWKTKY